MAPTKKSRSSSSKGASSSSMNLKKVKGENFYRDAKAASRLKMMSGGKPVYDRDGKIVEAAAFQKGEKDAPNGRVQPDRRWFGNTRVISQTALDHFRTSLAGKAHDPYSVLLRRNKLPMALLDDASNPNLKKRSHIVETEPFKDTFGPKKQRKRPRLDVSSFEELSKIGATKAEPTLTEGDPAASRTVPDEEDGDYANYNEHIEPIFSKGTSRRIYGELYKVIDSSDVVIHVLDARDPYGTLCESVLEYIAKEKAHKQVVLVINKCDLVPNWVTARYIQHLTPRYPTLAFHASPNHSFGKGSLIQLLRQFSRLHSDKKQISVGFIGYPNVGKSSIINTLKSGKVCRVAPIPGETKVWQYITLTRKIYLIDCPGIVPASAQDSQTAKVLKGVVRVEALPGPAEHIPELMSRVKPVYLSRTYGVPLPEDGTPLEPEAFLDNLARKMGRLLKGGEPDLDGVAKILLADWVRGRIPFFVPPPARPEELHKDDDQRQTAKTTSTKALHEDGETKPALSVPQKLGTIMQRNKFVEEDRGRDENLGFVAESSSAAEAAGSSDDEGKEEDASVEEEDEQLEWEDVWNGFDNPNPPEEDTPHTSVVDEELASGGGATDDEDEAADESGDDEGSTEAAPLRAPRMTTNKRKAANFYTNANVKNRNREKAKTLKSLQHQTGGSRSKGRRNGR